MQFIDCIILLHYLSNALFYYMHCLYIFSIKYIYQKVHYLYTFFNKYVNHIMHFFIKYIN